MMLENAARLCDAPLTLILLANDERTHLELAGYRPGASRDWVEFFQNTPIALDAETSIAAQCMLNKDVLQVEDAKNSKTYSTGDPHRVRAVDIEGMRTLLVVPLVSGSEGIGVLALWRREVKPFDDNNVELV